MVTTTQGASQGANAPLSDNNGTAANIPTEKGTSKMAPAPKDGGGKPIAVIPDDINTYDRLAAAQFYANTLGWAIHPLYGPDQGEPRERGKKAVIKGWRKHINADITPDFLIRHFAQGTRDNVGCVVRPPFVHIDLDSKPDAGASVMAWLSAQPELAAVPRERTAGGAHLVFICRDLPEEVMAKNQALCVAINEEVMAELYFNGLNLALSPSVHKTGRQYFWEVTGPIPSVKWADLCRWFGFATPEPKKPGAPRKNQPWWAQFKGDLHTLDLSAAFREAGLLGNCIDPDEGKWTVKCPWAENHSTGGKNWKPGDSSTVIFGGDGMPAFHCLHAHCGERKSQDVLLWLESSRPGIIDRHCALMRGKFAAEALRKTGIVSVWGEPAEGAGERLIARNGDPFYYRTKSDGEREVCDFNPHYWAARYAFENLVIFEPVRNLFYAYAPETGLWVWQTDATIRAAIAAWMLGYSRQLNQPLLDTGRTGDRLTHMLTILRAAAERRDPFRKFENLIHLRNCMIHLDGDRPEIRGFSPHYFSLSQCQVDFDPDADCPRFLGNLIRPAMSAQDAFLLQLVGGLYLTGRNNWQKMLVLTGVGGAGKGTIGRIIGSLIGSNNIKQLRTRLLGERFELDDIDQVSLLVGSDVAGDFLSCSGAKVIKALTGGDPLTLEFKGGRKRQVTGDHNVFITCNDRLRVQLDGDESAWHRRLLIIPFHNTPATSSPDIDRILMEEEGSGILNWFLLGAVHLARLARTGKRWPLTPEQKKRIDDLLAESDSLRAFVGSRVERDSVTTLTVDEIIGEYENFCADLGWSAKTKAQAERGLGPLMMEIHRAAKRNDIPRGNSNKRGFMGVRLIPTFDQSILQS